MADETIEEDTHAQDERSDAPASFDEDKQVAPEAQEVQALRKRAGVSPVVFVAGLLLASLAGGTIGIVGSKYLAGPDKIPGLRQEIKTDITKLEARIATDEDKQASLQKTSKAFTDSLDKINKQITEFNDQIDTLSSQIDAFSEFGTDLEALDKRLAVLESLAGEKSDLVKGANSIEMRLKALEERADAPQPPSITPEQMDGLRAEIEALKTQIDEIKSKSALVAESQRQTRQNISLPKDSGVDSREKTLRILRETFPRAKMLAAVRAQEHLAAQKPSWLERALRKHIRIRKEKPPDPYVLINSAQNKLKDGDIEAALERIAKLNPPVRAAAAEWVSAAKTALKEQARTQE
ncbi:MAG TPA: hypothetical protein ENK01_02355 [Hellea balneolensis]|uniref:Uncharacterized protein n=1 Tax=Hellea balneolensis TaxID=287478 RepID=A0A7V5U131_9PROT|nr:hypothetical protein [Hellea balneolensis]